MKLRSLIFAATTLATLPLLDGSARAQAAGGTTYDVVSSYQMSSSIYVTVTGVVHGQSAASTTEFTVQSGVKDQCERMLLVMMNRPGRFQLTFDQTNAYHCSLTAVP
jgi:hypothetical protein